MNSVKNLKLTVAWLVIFILSILFDQLSHKNFTTSQYLAFLSYVPFDSLADACITTILVSFIYEFWIRKETYQQIQNTLFTPHIVKDVLTTSNLEKLLNAGLQRVLKDETFGNDIYNFISKSAIFTQERRYNAHTIVTLLPLSNNECRELINNDRYRRLTVDQVLQVSPSDAGSSSVERNAGGQECKQDELTEGYTAVEQERMVDDYMVHYYELILDYEYQKKLSSTNMCFCCVETAEQYYKTYGKSNVEWRWETERMRLFPLFNAQFYKVESLYIEDEAISVIDLREKDNGDVDYIAKVPAKYRDGGAKKVKYRVRLKVQRFSHLLKLDIREPTNNLRVTFDFSKTDISHVNVFSSFSSPAYPALQYYPDVGNAHRIDVSIDEWTIPQSGVAFTWVLNLEKNYEIKKMCLLT